MLNLRKKKNNEFLIVENTQKDIQLFKKNEIFLISYPRGYHGNRCNIEFSDINLAINKFNTFCK